MQGRQAETPQGALVYLPLGFPWGFKMNPV